MELYHKKVNLGTKPTTEENYNTSRRPRNIYFQKMIKKNQNQKHNETFEGSIGRENLPNIRSSMEDILSEENNKKKGVKYANQKNRDLQSPDSTTQIRKRIDKSASPRHMGGYPRDYNNEDNREATPLRKVLNLSREPYYSEVGKRFNTINNDTKAEPNNIRKKNIRTINRKNFKNQYNDGEDDDYYDNQQNYLNPEESQNDYEFSSIQDDEKIANGLKFSRSPPPMRNRNQFTKVIKNPRYNETRNKDIQVMPKLRKQPTNTNYLSNNINSNTDEDVDELLRTIEDLQSIINAQKNEIRKLKKDNYNKNKENILLKNELDDLQK